VDHNVPVVLKDGDVITFGSVVSDVVYVFREVATKPQHVDPTIDTTSKNAWAAGDIVALTPKRNSTKITSNGNAISNNTNIETPNNNNINSNNITTKRSNTRKDTETSNLPSGVKPTNTNNLNNKSEEENDEEELKFNSSFSFHSNKLKRKPDDDLSCEPKLVKMHNQIYQIGEEVEAKCQKPTVPEYNAWFEATIINFDPENNLYTIRFKGYTDYYNEQLPVDCIRYSSDGDWKWSEVDIGTLVIAKYDGWWYDAIVTKKLTPPKAKSKKPCLQVKLVDLPDIEKKCIYDDVFLPQTKK